MTNNLWIGANLLFEAQTGKTTQVFQFVFREEDATALSRIAAENVQQFVSVRSAPFAKISWSIEPSSTRRGFFVVKGLQEVD